MVISRDHGVVDDWKVKNAEENSSSSKEEEDEEYEDWFYLQHQWGQPLGSLLGPFSDTL